MLVTLDLAPNPASVGEARRFTVDTLRRWGRDDLTTSGAIERTDPLYFVRYPWADPKPGDPPLIIATTRPETILVVVGEFKQGKSSIVNGLLGEQLCPVDDDIATAALTVVSAHHATRGSVGALLLDVRLGHDLGREVEPLAKEVAASIVRSPALPPAASSRSRRAA